MDYGGAIGLGLLAGILARVLMLRSDYRQYPTYPHGYSTHLFMGIFASLAGAVTVPALLEGEWTAVTFFLLVAEQFRSIRGMERDSLKALEDSELVPRGTEYIENIARVFETRYYIVIVVAAATALGAIKQSPLMGLVFGAVVFMWGAILTRVETIGETVEVEAAPVIVRGSDVLVGDIFIFSVGLKESQEFIKERALGAILTPKNDEGRDTLASQGQRQAMLHDAASILGVRRDADNPEFAPQAKRDIKTGRVAVYVVPMDKDQGLLLEMLRRAPVLESARGRARFVRLGYVGKRHLHAGRNRIGGNHPEGGLGGRHR
ncbi:MAG TPA: hypothetical protein GX512_08030 [Firmicutes bacterium]|nr:hypothetical protein [Candidatus Fermentithermobacillaceae bacterium]